MTFREHSFFYGEKKDSKSLSIAILVALTEDDIDIIRQRDLFFHVLSFFCSFLFLLGTHVKGVLM